MALIVIIAYNAIFVLSWLYLYFDSLNIKNENFKAFLKVYSFLVCKKRVIEQKRVEKKDDISAEK